MHTATFENERKHLLGVAYRMLGSLSLAEDVVQECWLRWTSAEGVRTPRSWLVTVVTRLCLDELKSARHRRESYFGTWLPEPWIDHAPDPDPWVSSTLSFAFLRLLEQLTPPQRAAFLLRDVFDYDYSDVAQVLHTSPANTRQLVRRARTHLSQTPRFDVDPSAQFALMAAFGQAAQDGDLGALEAILSEHASAWSDGGGKRTAAAVPIVGGARVAKAYIGFARLAPPDLQMRLTWVNGFAGVVLSLPDGTVYSVHTFEVIGGRVSGVYSVLNPDKLTHVKGSIPQ